MHISKSKVSKLVAGLNSGVEGEAKCAAALLDELLHPSYPRLVTAAESRRIAESHYSALRGAEAIGPLLDAARDATPFARAYALTALGAIGDLRALPLAMDASSDASPAVRISATKALLFFRDPAALPALIHTLDDPNPEVRHSAAFALGFIRSADAVPPLMTFYERGDPESKMAALYALGHIGDARSLPLARDALFDRVRKVRRAAKAALTQYDLKRRHGSIKITGPNAGGPRQFPIRKSLAARVARFWRSACRQVVA